MAETSSSHNSSSDKQPKRDPVSGMQTAETALPKRPQLGKADRRAFDLHETIDSNLRKSVSLSNLVWQSIEGDIAADAAWALHDLLLETQQAYEELDGMKRAAAKGAA